MKIDIIKCLLDKHKDYVEHEPSHGPVITISREFGCEAKIIAQKLSAKLNEICKNKKNDVEWNWINKEILEASSNELNLKPSRIKHVFDSKKKGFIGDLITAHSEKYYTSDSKIKNAIYKVIRSFAQDGNVIIVGRGGASITRDMPNSLHIRIMAPFDWRVKQVCKKRNLAQEQVELFAKDIDQKRQVFKDFFANKPIDITIFDLVFNRMTVTEDEIVESIINLVELRKLI